MLSQIITIPVFNVQQSEHYLGLMLDSNLNKTADEKNTLYGEAIYEYEVFAQNIENSYLNTAEGLI